MTLRCLPSAASSGSKRGRDLGLSETREELKQLKKSDSRKVVCAARVKRRTSVGNEWIAERLAMGYPASMSQHVNRMLKEPKAAKQLKMYEQTLKSKD
jgi:hypothetical protein